MTTVDYLSQLPIEIWREIFLLDTPFLAAESFSNKPDWHSDMVAERKLQTHQSRRYQLLTICKSLHSLIESLLYTEVNLRAGPKVKRFIRVAYKRQKQQGNCSEHTRSVFIYSGHSSDLSDGFKLGLSGPLASSTDSFDVTLLSLLPNLRQLYIQWLRRPGVDDKTDYLQLPLDGIQNLHTLSWEGMRFNSPAMRSFSLRASNLIHLNIFSSWSLSEEDNQELITFPSVRSMTFDLCATTSGLTPRLRCPSLQRLLIRVDRFQHIVSFIVHCCPRIVDLQLVKPLSTENYHKMVIPGDLFTACKHLQRLSFHIDIFNPLTDDSFTTHEQLKNLTLSLFSPTYSSDLVQRLRCFSKERFPNLSSITFIINRVHRRGDLDFFRVVVAELFPEIDSTLQISDHSFALDESAAPKSASGRRIFAILLQRLSKRP